MSVPMSYPRGAQDTHRKGIAKDRLSFPRRENAAKTQHESCLDCSGEGGMSGGCTWFGGSGWITRPAPVPLAQLSGNDMQRRSG